MSPYEMKTFTSRFATFLVDNPFKSVSVALLLAILMIPGVRLLQSDFSYRIWFRETDPMLSRFDVFERRFGNDEMITLLVHSPDGIFDKESIDLVMKMTEDMWQVPEVIRVDSLTNYNWTHSEDDDLMVEPLIPDDLALTPELLEARKKVALAHEVIPGYLVSPDAKTALIFGQLKPAIGGTPDFQVVMDGTRELIGKHIGKDHTTFDHLTKYEGNGHEVYVIGTAAVNQTFKEITISDMKIMVPILLSVIVIFLLFSYRNISGVLLTFVVIGFSITMTLGIAGWQGIKLNNLTSIVPHILIAIAVADVVHIMVTFLRFRASGLVRKEAAHKTIVKNFKPTLITSISTAIGFFSFASADIVPIVYLGLLAGIGTLIAWLITIFLLTPLLVHLPVKVKIRTQVSHNEAHPMVLRYAHWLQRNSIAVVSVFTIVAGFAFYIAFQNEVNSDPFKYFAQDVQTRFANDFYEDKVGGANTIEVVINSGSPDGIKEPEFLKKVEAFEVWLNDLEHVTKTVSILDVIKQSNRALHGDAPEAYKLPDTKGLIAQELFLYTMSLPQGMDISNRVSLDNDYLRITIFNHLHNSRDLLKFYDEIEAQIAHFGLIGDVTGKNPLYQRLNPYVVNAFVKSITMAFVLVALLMMFVFKSWRLGLLSMVPNVLPIIFGGALMTLMGKSLDIGTVLVTSTCLGIAVDDTVHFLSNYNSWRKLGVSRAEAVAQVITHTGPALAVTTLVLVAGFTTFIFADFVPNINFGILTAIVLTSALLTDMTFLPALMLLRQSEETEEVTEMLPA